ncbi:hypothetical protein SAMN05444365_111112 [Micromonospora pattaloongensis]|uniref:Glycolipid-binding n=2 Tax=Micromonospora pattaloongensis TaxID=405436 RepID=A0A1H3SHX2_9ACTN|nr:hypothetical protein SAMN05444365_111112 [Micromonospora pattaloongensis]
MPKSLFWIRTDTAGTDHVLLNDQRGLSARGVATAVTPVPYTCTYSLVTDEHWATSRFEVTVEGAGWVRTLKMERALGRWRVSTAEQGDLAAALRAAGHGNPGYPGTEEPGRLEGALDVDLGHAPLFNTLPIRRLGLREGDVGTQQRIEVAWVHVPSLEVLPATQGYTIVDPNRARFAVQGFTAELELDDNAYVTHYPGLAERR